MSANITNCGEFRTTGATAWFNFSGTIINHPSSTWVNGSEEFRNDGTVTNNGTIYNSLLINRDGAITNKEILS